MSQRTKRGSVPNEAKIPAERSEDPSLTLRVSKDGSPIRSVSEVSSTNPKRDNRLQGVLKGVFKKGVHVQTESCEFL
jgi:hypothetical protein